MKYYFGGVLFYPGGGESSLLSTGFGSCRMFYGRFLLVLGFVSLSMSLNSCDMWYLLHVLVGSDFTVGPGSYLVPTGQALREKEKITAMSPL